MTRTATASWYLEALIARCSEIVPQGDVGLPDILLWWNANVPASWPHVPLKQAPIPSPLAERLSSRVFATGFMHFPGTWPAVHYRERWIAMPDTVRALPQAVQNYLWAHELAHISALRHRPAWARAMTESPDGLSINDPRRFREERIAEAAAMLILAKLGSLDEELLPRYTSMLQHLGVPTPRERASACAAAAWVLRGGL